MNVSPGAPRLLRVSPPPFALGEGHKLCWPDSDEMRATWIPTHPSLAAQTLRVRIWSWPGWKVPASQPRAWSFHSGTPKEGIRFRLELPHFWMVGSHRHGSVLPLFKLWQDCVLWRKLRRVKTQLAAVLLFFFQLFLKIKNLSAVPWLGNLRQIKIYGVKGLG